MIVQVDTAGWARWPEVEKFAYLHEMTLEEAVIALVNSGLSHLP